jgi:predicted alpha/beta-fold hydrolase
MSAIYRAVAARRPVPFPVERLAEIRLIRDWDDCIVAPRHGFSDAADYHARASVAPRLPDLQVPALLLNSECDPMVPARAVRPGLERASTRLRVAWVRAGHVAFPRGLNAGLSEGIGMDAQVIGWLRSRSAVE